MFVFHRSETYYEIRGHIPIFKKIGDHFQIDKIWIIDSTCKIILKVLLISKYEMLKAYYFFHVLGGQVSLFILRYYSVWFREYKVLSWPSLGYLDTMRSYSVWCRNCKIWVRSEVFGISCLLSWPAFIWLICFFSALPYKNKTWFFSSVILFIKDRAINFSSPKKYAKLKQDKVWICTVCDTLSYLCCKND